MTNLERIRTFLSPKTSLRGVNLLSYLQWVHDTEPNTLKIWVRALILQTKLKRRVFRIPQERIDTRRGGIDYPDEIFLAVLQDEVAQDESLVSYLKFHFLSGKNAPKQENQSLQEAKKIPLPDLYPFSPPLNPERESGSRCPLPGHDDSTPSFRYYPNGNRFHCYGCGEYGDTVDFVRLMDDKLSFREAVTSLVS